MYLDEAVVEEHADEAGADAGVGAHGLLHLGPHEGLGPGACRPVVAHLEAVARRGQNQGARDCQAELNADSHDCRLITYQLEAGANQFKDGK